MPRRFLNIEVRQAKINYTTFTIYIAGPSFSNSGPNTVKAHPLIKG